MYNLVNAQQCISYCSSLNSVERVLIVGSGDGADVLSMRKLLGSSVLIIGIDLDTHEETFPKLDNTLIFKADITQPGIFGEFFDLAYSFATFEHVNSPRDGWQNMVNMLRPGGVLWSVSSPLWLSPYGHHKDMLKGHPWAHLLHDNPASLLKYCTDQGIQSPDEIDLVHHVNYIYHPAPFNRLSAKEYSLAASSLNNVDIEINDFDLLEPDNYSRSAFDHLCAKGFTVENLLSQTHRLVATKK
jgi:SAM-dependent methyltransferase